VGFFDSIKGFGTSIFETLGAGVQAVLPSFLEAGAGALFGSLFPGQQPAGSQVFRRPALGPTAPLLLPRGTGSFGLPQQRRTVTGVTGQQVVLPGGRAGPTQLFGGAAVPHFPGDQFGVTQAAFPAIAGGAALGALGGALDLFDLPGIDLQLPFRADARTGGTPFFLPSRAVGNRPRSLIMVPNPSTGAPTFFKHAGRPILFSGDLRAAKLVNRIARRARRASPRR